jgi:hypothetical protein
MTLQWFDSSSEEEKAALRWFKRGGDTALSAVAMLDYFKSPRDAKADQRFELPVNVEGNEVPPLPVIRRGVRVLSEFLSRAPITREPMYIFRGLKMDGQTANDVLDIDGPITVTAFQSFSRSPIVAAQFSNPLTTIVRIPKGVRVADTSFFISGSIPYMEELEIIIPPGSVLRTRVGIKYQETDASAWLTRFLFTSETQSTDQAVSLTPSIVMDWVSPISNESVYLPVRGAHRTSKKGYHQRIRLLSQVVDQPYTSSRRVRSL